MLWELIIVAPYLSGRGKGREGPPNEDLDCDPSSATTLGGFLVISSFGFSFPMSKMKLLVKIVFNIFF